MADFSHLKQYNVSTETFVEFPLDMLDGRAVLHLAPASESNKGYFNALLRKAPKAARAGKLAKVDVNVVKNNRDDDRALYAKHIIKGWSGLFDSQGEEVLFSEEEVISLLEHLPDWIFDEIRAFASNVQNFIEFPVDVEGKAKN